MVGRGELSEIAIADRLSPSSEHFATFLSLSAVSFECLGINEVLNLYKSGLFTALYADVNRSSKDEISK
jgi:hypothetical protein